jgi:cytosine permease
VTWGIPSLLSLFLSMALYIVAGKLGWVRGVGVATTRQTNPVEETAAA